jgi:hypothetical protein
MIFDTIIKTQLKYFNTETIYITPYDQSLVEKKMYECSDHAIISMGTMDL